MAIAERNERCGHAYRYTTAATRPAGASPCAGTGSGPPGAPIACAVGSLALREHVFAAAVSLTP